MRSKGSEIKKLEKYFITGDLVKLSLAILKLFSREKDQRSNCESKRNMEGKKS